MTTNIGYQYQYKAERAMRALRIDDCVGYQKSTNLRCNFDRVGDSRLIMCWPPHFASTLTNKHFEHNNHGNGRRLRLTDDRTPRISWCNELPQPSVVSWLEEHGDKSKWIWWQYQNHPLIHSTERTREELAYAGIGSFTLEFSWNQTQTSHQ